MKIRRAFKTKALLRVQFLLTSGGRGEEQEASALLSKKGGGREGSIENQQKFDFFSYDDTHKDVCMNSRESILRLIFQLAYS